jgi:hypothetical protein
MQVLDAVTGETRATIPGADGLWQSRHAHVAVVSWYQQVSLLDTADWTRRWRAPVQGFAILDASFAPDGLVIADTGEDASIYCFSLSGDLLWRQRQPSGMLLWAVDWDEASDEWVGLRHQVDRLAPDAIVRWSRAGEVVAIREIRDVVDGAFLPGGRRLVTTTRAIDSLTGQSTDLPLASD